MEVEDSRFSVIFWSWLELFKFAKKMFFFALCPLWCRVSEMVCKLDPWTATAGGCNKNWERFHDDPCTENMYTGELTHWFHGTRVAIAHPQFTGEYFYLGQNAEAFGWLTAHLLSPTMVLDANQWYEERSDEDGRHCIKPNRFRRSWLFWKDLENIISLSVTSCPFSRSNQKCISFVPYLKQTQPHENTPSQKGQYWYFPKPFLRGKLLVSGSVFVQLSICLGPSQVSCPWSG